jgi:hypothetical protein
MLRNARHLRTEMDNIAQRVMQVYKIRVEQVPRSAQPCYVALIGRGFASVGNAPVNTLNPKADRHPLLCDATGRIVVLVQPIHRKV